MQTAQEHAAVYWASRPVKKWVVTLRGGRNSNAWTRTVYVSARNQQRAVNCAAEQAVTPSKPRAGAARLATWADLGCVPVSIGSAT